MTVDLGLTHIALPVADVDQSIEFYTTYARMQVIHRRADSTTRNRRVEYCRFTVVVNRHRSTFLEYNGI